MRGPFGPSPVRAEDGPHRRCGYCLEVAAERVRDGLPLRAEIHCVGFIASVPTVAPVEPFLSAPAATAATRALVVEDVAELGFVSSSSRLWMNDPALLESLFELVVPTANAAGLTFAERAVATIVAAAAVGDTYCPLAWGHKLASTTTPEVAGAVLLGDDDVLDERGRAIVAWARKVLDARGPTTAADVEQLREVGFDDPEILRLTLFIGLRVAFSTVNPRWAPVLSRSTSSSSTTWVRQAWLTAIRP